MESILTSIKKLVGVAETDDAFDTDIIIHINTAFMSLTDLKVGPSTGFIIEDDTTVWTDFIRDPKKLAASKTYVYLRVKLLFDPGSLSSATIASMEKQVEKLEWLLNVDAESGSSGIINGDVSEEIAALIAELESENEELKILNSELTSEKLALESNNSILNSRVKSLESSNTALQTANGSLLIRNTELEESNATLQTENNSLLTRNEALETSNAELTITNEALQGENASLEAENAQLELRVEELESSIKPEQEKSVTIIENGTVDILPDDGNTLSKVAVNVDVPSSGETEELESLIDESRVLDSTDGSVEDKVEQLIGKVKSLELPDWNDDSQIVESGHAYNSQNNLEWELTEKGTFRWKFKEGVTGNNRAEIFSSVQLSLLSTSYKKIASKIKQVYFPDGVIFAEVVYAINCKRIRFPDTLTTTPNIAGLVSLKELDLSSEKYTKIPDYYCSNMVGLEKVQLCHKITTLSRNSFERCYSLKEINLENITDFSQACLDSDFGLTGAIVFNPELTVIAATAFRYTNITSVTFQNPTTGIHPTIQSSAFQGCKGIQEVIVPEGWAASLYFPDASLTQEVLHAMIEKFADMTGQTSPTLQVGNANIAKIDEEHINMLVAKNWIYK